MTLEMIRATFAWCSVINLALFFCWMLFFTCAHDWMHKFHSRWFKLSVEQFDVIHYCGMAGYKLAIFIFNLVPYFALRIIA